MTQPTEPQTRVHGWITGNQYEERGYYDGGKGKPNGEPWYVSESGQHWSAYDVEFFPYHEFHGAPHPNNPNLLLCDFLFDGRQCGTTQRWHDEHPTQPSAEQIDLGLQWGENAKREPGRTHTEWYAPCGCAYHPSPSPHIHPCSDEHKRPDLHMFAQEQAIVTAAREWATAWGKVWEGVQTATSEINDKSKALHDAVLDLEREIVLRRRRAIMPGYDQKLEDWLS